MSFLTMSASDSERSLPPCLADCETAVHGLQEVGRLFYARGWSVGTSSNFSCVCERTPLELLITASGRDKGALRPDDFVRVARDGRPTSPGQPKSSAETLLHCLLAEDPRVGAVLHTHSVWGTLLSDLHGAEQGFAIEGYEMLKGLEGITTHEQRVWIDIFENSQDIPALVDTVRQRWANRHADGDPRDSVVPPNTYGFLLRQHGLYTWGADLFAARRHVEILEFLFECVARKRMLRHACGLEP
jgi:methylthioribulose-1-phosphate dehydratase